MSEATLVVELAIGVVLIAIAVMVVRVARSPRPDRRGRFDIPEGVSAADVARAYHDWMVVSSSNSGASINIDNTKGER